MSNGMRNERAFVESGRALHLIDIENVLGGRVTTDRVEMAWQHYTHEVGIMPGDAVVVAVAQRNAALAVFALPADVRRVVGANVPDGADLALAEAVDVCHAATRYKSIYIASGDHYFTALARSFRDRGCAVTQVIGAARVSAALYRACSADIRLELDLPEAA